MKVFTVLLVGMLLLTQAPFALAQQPSGESVAKPTAAQSEWRAIEAVPEGTDMVVETKAGEMFKGKLVSVRGSTLTLSRKNKIFPIELPQVQKAYRYVGRSRKKSTAIGAVAGGTAGLGLGLGVYLPDQNDIVGAVVPGLAIIGAGIGAVIGVATARGRTKVLIYEAK